MIAPDGRPWPNGLCPGCGANRNMKPVRLNDRDQVVCVFCGMQASQYKASDMSRLMDLREKYPAGPNTRL